MIAGAVAAMMSTVDSQLLVAASAIEEDVYIRLLGGHPRDRAAVWIGRITVLGLGAVALPIAWSRAGVFETVFNAWGVLGAGIGPVVVLGLLSRRTNRWGALVGMLVGAGIAQSWVWVAPLLPKHALYANGLVLGFFANLLLAYVVSVLTGGRRGEEAPTAERCAEINAEAAAPRGESTSSPTGTAGSSCVRQLRDAPRRARIGRQDHAVEDQAHAAGVPEAFGRSGKPPGRIQLKSLDSAPCGTMIRRFAGAGRLPNARSFCNRVVVSRGLERK